MKKLTLALAFTVGAFGVSYAQMDEKTLMKTAKKASKLHKAYLLNTTDDTKLMQASEMVDQLLADENGMKNDLVLITKGNVLNEMAGKDLTMKAVDPNTVVEKPEAPLEAVEYFKKVLGSSDTKMVAAAKKGLNTSHNYAGQIGNALLGQSKYKEAYKYMNAILDIADAVDGTNFADPSGINDHKYLVAFCAQQAGDDARALEIANQLIDDKYEEARIYSIGFASAEKLGKAEEGLAILDKGKKIYPGNQEILYAEINYLIGIGDYEKLEALLASAVEADPENASVRSALGNVLMNLSGSFYGKDDAKSDAYFERAKSNFDKAAELDPTMVDAVYSVGSLYYNRAVEVQKQMNELPFNKSKEIKEKEELFKQYFDDALPYFQKAETMQPGDRNTLIALKEIYARKNDFETSGIFKKRIEQLEAGQQITESYFKK